jgi:hypothetical protein
VGLGWSIRSVCVDRFCVNEFFDLMDALEFVSWFDCLSRHFALGSYIVYVLTYPLLKFWLHAQFDGT